MHQAHATAALGAADQLVADAEETAQKVSRAPLDERLLSDKERAVLDVQRQQNREVKGWAFSQNSYVALETIKSTHPEIYAEGVARLKRKASEQKQKADEIREERLSWQDLK